MGLNYKLVAEYAKATNKICEIERLTKRQSFFVDKRKDRTYKVGKVEYSPQELLIHQDLYVRDDWYLHILLPEGITRTLTKVPNKEYISFEDAAGVKRYYLVPKDGLRLKKKGSTYSVVNPIQDYSICVDRTAAKKARESAEGLIHYVNTIWDLVMAPTDVNQRPKDGFCVDRLPAEDDKDGWFQLVMAAKYPGNYIQTYSLSTVIQKIRNKFTEEALAYHVTPVPDTKMDLTEHWYRLEALRAAGRLKEYEGNGKRRTRKK